MTKTVVESLCEIVEEVQNQLMMLMMKVVILSEFVS